MAEHRQLNNFFMRIRKRAEGVDRATLVQTFVDMDPLVTLLSSRDHQVIYGRRGTGKSHALQYIEEKQNAENNLTVYVDMRTIGSSGGIYFDPNVPRAERGTRLLIDTLESLHDSLLNQIVARAEELDLSVLGPRLDALADAVSEVQVIGTTELTESIDIEEKHQISETEGLGVGKSGITVSLKQTTGSSDSTHGGIRKVQSGQSRHRVHFGSLSKSLTRIVESIGGRRLWIFLDEWSAVPIDLQPLLADLIRRSILPVQGLVVKIGAIEHRSVFQDRTEQGDYLGIELGADVSADINLDDFMVFESGAERAKAFFAQLIYKHVAALAAEDGIQLSHATPDELIGHAFSRRDVFEEYVRASEGVPRDAINILSLAARQADNNSITMDNVRVAARIWYERDKQAAVNANPDARNLLFRIIDRVIGHRRTRAFLFKSNTRHPLIDELFDKRVLHMLKRNVSSKDEPGVRYDVYKIDYGCYVDLLATAKAPQGLLPFDNSEGESFVEVPPDDYRAIRRAILTIEELEKIEESSNGT